VVDNNWEADSLGETKALTLYRSKAVIHSLSSTKTHAKRRADQVNLAQEANLRLFTTAAFSLTLAQNVICTAREEKFYLQVID